MNLFLDEDMPRNDFFKESAYAARMSDTPENWPQELSSEILRQLPYLSDYDLNVNLQTVEPQRGFAFGYADISNKTERPEEEHAESGIPHIRIPVIIQDRAAKPFTVFLDGDRVIPLTEDRIRQTLFNPQMFDLTNSAPRDPSLIEPLTPPQRGGPGMGGEYKVAEVIKEALSPGFMARAVQNSAAVGKGVTPERAKKVLGVLESRVGRASQVSREAGRTALQNKIPVSQAFQNAPLKAGMGVGPQAATVVQKPTQAGATAITSHQALDKIVAGRVAPLKKVGSLLFAIADTIREQDSESFVQKVASSPNIIAGLRRAGIASDLVNLFDNCKTASADERLNAILDNIEPTVVTFLKLPGNDFLVKSASVKAFAGDKKAKGQVVPEEEVAEAIGPENAQAMKPGQSATAVAEPVSPPVQYETNEKVIDQFGEWLVQDSMGNRIMGWVFPQTLAWDGTFAPQPIALFTNGSAYAFQEVIAGELVGKSTTMPVDSPRGDGVFYCVKGGNAIATQPVSIGSAVAGPDGLPKFVVSDSFGNQFQVSKAAGLNEPTRVSDVEFALPEHWEFMRLNNQTQLATDPVQMNKAASARAEANTVTVIYNGSYHVRGGCGIDKLAYEFTNELDSVGTEFILGLLGVDGVDSKLKIAEARKRGSIKIAGLLPITTVAERYTASVKTASALYSKIPDLRVDLVKEAASLNDGSTVNDILALNFINPENLGTFISYIPELEKTSEKLAEMWLYSVLGLNELPEDSITTAMHGMEKVLEGLKSIAHAEA